MSTQESYRLYSFVAGLYLSDLQKGLQTAHVVGEMLADTEMLGKQRDALMQWADQDKTIIICTAGNHGGVLECWAEIERLSSSLNLPSAVFHEDEQSMNKMATACGVVVPKQLYDAKFIAAESFTPDEANVQALFINNTDRYEYTDDVGHVRIFRASSPEGQFIKLIKSYRLA